MHGPLNVKLMKILFKTKIRPFVFEKYRHILNFEIPRFGNNKNLSCHVYIGGKKNQSVF